MRKSLSRRVLELLRDSQGATLKEISSAVDASLGRVRTVLYELKAKGYVERIGKVYIITERGRKFLEYVEHAESTALREEKAGEQQLQQVRREEVEKREEIAPSSAQPVEAEQKSTLLGSIVERLSELERRVSALEKAVKDLEKALEAVQRRKSEVSLESPVLPYSYVATKLGALLDKLLAENRLVRIGSLVVDSQFYAEFRSKFPIKLSDLEKLTPYERTLLEEMRKEALVILHAGREYRLVD